MSTRYYNPALGRFINADALAATGQGLMGNNMFAYCLNNPVLRVDALGSRAVINDRDLIAPANDSTIIDTILHIVNTIAVYCGIDTAGIGADCLGFYESDPGVFHAAAKCWQRVGGYNVLYDKIFDIGTSMSAVSFPFTHNGMEYIIWAWKGDYINLGAGAELGIYFGGGPHWFATKHLSMPMSVSLDYHGTNIISHSSNTWWITGFNSNYLNLSPYCLKATYFLDFSSNPALYESFYDAYYGNPWWSFNYNAHTATLVF